MKQREKGEIRKFTYTFRTLDDPLLKDGLEGVSLLTGKEPYYLVGGIATQTYLPTSCRRPTADVDFSVVRPLNYTDFKGMVKPLLEYFQDIGYSVETKKRSRAYSIDFTDPTGDTVSLEFSRRNEKAFERNKGKLERELDNANSKIVEGRDSTYLVARTEDIVIPKIARSIGSLKRYPHLSRYLPKTVESLSDEKVFQQLSKIKNLREEAIINMSDPETAEKLRFISDLYDIRILSEIAGLNSRYASEVEKDWKVFSEESREKDRVISSVFPSTLI